MIKLSLRNQEILLGLVLIFILFMVGFSAYFEGIRNLIFYGFLLLSILLTCVFFKLFIKSKVHFSLHLKKVEQDKKQLLEYIDASWDSNQKIVHEEKILAIKYMMVGISHEINTPLGNAVTSISVLESLLHKNGIDDKNINTALELSQVSIKRTIDLVTRFKDVAHFTIGEEQKNFNLKKLLNSIMEVKRHEWLNESIEQFVNSSDDLILNSYPQSLSIVLGVFLDNARESFAGKGGKIDIICEHHGKNLLITVKDTGPGIKPENIEHIFDPFFTTTRSEKHLGLGLSMAHNLIINLFKGELQVKSEWKQGTEMKIYLPDILDVAKVNLK